MATRLDFYQILGIARTASQNQIDEAYWMLATRLHPGFNPNTTFAMRDQMHQVNRAYVILGNPYTRRQYDVLGDKMPGWLPPNTTRTAHTQIARHKPRKKPEPFLGGDKFRIGALIIFLFLVSLVLSLSDMSTSNNEESLSDLANSLVEDQVIINLMTQSSNWQAMTPSYNPNQYGADVRLGEACLIRNNRSTKVSVYEMTTVSPAIVAYLQPGEDRLVVRSATQDGWFIVSFVGEPPSVEPDGIGVSPAVGKIREQDITIEACY